MKSGSSSKSASPSLANQVKAMGLLAKEAAPAVGAKTEGEKNRLLDAISEQIAEQEAAILKANAKDMAEGKKIGLNKALLDRLALTPARLKGIREALVVVRDLPDPIGEILGGWRRPNGLEITQIRVPLGVVGMIYESRPNVTVDAAALSLKSGNAVLLKGGKEAMASNTALMKAIQDALKAEGWPVASASLLPFTDRAATTAMMGLRGILDVLIPRGGSGLIQAVVQNAKVPTLETGVGNCHLFVDASADLDNALAILLNAKTQRPGVCNSVEKLLVHQDIAKTFLPMAAKALEAKGVELRGCAKTRTFIKVHRAIEKDWETEYLDLILGVKVVSGIQEAIDHIRRYSSQHSETILSNDLANVDRFAKEVDAADVFINASSRFADGGEYGFGAEIGISTQKLHARGPLGLKALTTTKYIVRGQGQTRP